HLASFGFGPLAIAEIQHEGDTLVALFVEIGRADQHRHTATVLAEVLLLERLRPSGRLHLFNGASSAFAPFRRRQVRPEHTTGDEIFTVIAHHAEKRVVGLDYPTFELPKVDADDVGVDQTSDLAFSLFEIAVQMS